MSAFPTTGQDDEVQEIPKTQKKGKLLESFHTHTPAPK